MTTLAAERVGAGTFGFLVILLLFVATWFLIANMRKRLDKLPPEFTPGQDESDESASGPTAGA